jgi:hypothetical protein
MPIFAHMTRWVETKPWLILRFKIHLNPFKVAYMLLVDSYLRNGQFFAMFTKKWLKSLEKLPELQ